MEPAQPVSRATAIPPPPPAAADSMNLENRMKKLEENLVKQHRQTVEEALKNVRT